jgi:hypothetical protein
MENLMNAFRIFLLSLSALACAGAAGCAADGADPSADDVDPEEGVTSEQGLSQTVTVANPSGVYFANVTANGTGCPSGTWDAAISEDGKAFTLTFSQYEALVEPSRSFAIKDCAIGIDLKTPSGYSFAVSGFHYQGYAILDRRGMSAKQTAKYYFQGDPTMGIEKQSTMTGPYDDAYTFTDKVPVASMVWSPCGTTRRLNANTRLLLRNNWNKTGTGYINTISVDGEAKTKFVFDLAWKTC